MQALLTLLLLVTPAGAADADRRNTPWADMIFMDKTISHDPELSGLLKRFEKGNIPKVQFDFDEYVVKLESYVALDMIADVMLKHPDLKLKIVAHTCTIGTKEYNQKLSVRRAKAVMDFLADRGVPPPSMRYRGAGFEEPIADNSTEEGREKNRRVEFRFTNRDWGSVY
jgi:outer membrane protein OmpA-like peptidoglycan-associated protein